MNTKIFSCAFLMCSSFALFSSRSQTHVVISHHSFVNGAVEYMTLRQRVNPQVGDIVKTIEGTYHCVKHGERFGWVRKK